MPETNHIIHYGDARELSFIRDSSIGLVVTSPPYPMIEMWDELFCTLDPDIKKELTANRGQAAWENMHRQLDTVWQGLDRVVSPGGFVCVNIGDATRKTGPIFQLYPNHARIIRTFSSLGWQTLPLVLWRKSTNAPNKFMGSGMLPAGAYVTLEHEYILIFRKEGKREFKSEAEKQQRRASAFFWEERNCWFSDTWNLAGIRQNITAAPSRARSAAFPFELAYRLINMYSVKDDTVLDPFLGTGTTTLAAMAGCRNSIGLEIDKHFRTLIKQQVDRSTPLFNRIIDDRLQAHIEFIRQYSEKGKEPQHKNKHYKFPVITNQETELLLDKIHSLHEDNTGNYTVQYLSNQDSARMNDTIMNGTSLPAIRRRKPKSAPANENPEQVVDQGLLDFDNP